jgi:hypothetical protein
MLVTVRAWALEGRPLAFRVETRGALAARPVNLLVFVDGRHVADARTRGGVARVEVPATALSGGGRRRIVVKTGSERTWFDVTLLRCAWLWAGGALLLAAAGGTALLARRRGR